MVPEEQSDRVRVALLDDYQGIAVEYGPWERLGERVAVEAFRDHLDADEDLLARLEPFTVVVAMRERTPFTRERLTRLPNLRLLVTTGMTNAAIDIEAAAELGITVTGTTSGLASTTELTWALILAVTRHVMAEDRNVRAGGWQLTVGPELAGRTLGLVGLGRLGKRVAAIAQAFDMRVAAWSQNLDPEDARAVDVEPLSKEDLLRRADILSIQTRLSERTRGLIGAAELALMQPTAFLVNTSRGPIVDETALVAALRSGQIAGAALDVFDREPLPPGHPLLEVPNTILTPHIGYVSEDNYRSYYREIVENIAGWLDGTPPRVVA